MGATVYPDGVNFSVFSKNSESVELLFFEHADDEFPSREISLNPKINKSFYYWHIFVPGIKPGQLYGWRVYRKTRPKPEFRFDGWKLLIDPYARAVIPSSRYDRHAAARPGNNTGQAVKSVVIDSRDGFDWEQEEPLRVTFDKSVIYELHVGGFTKHPSSGVAPEKRGKFAGVIEKIPYLQALGVTAVELLPIQQFDEQDLPDGSTLTNYWGYSPMAFFSLHRSYCMSDDPHEGILEFKSMVKALHKAGIEVIMDVVFNHTSEGGKDGPIQSFKGLENGAYYLLSRSGTEYLDFSGCGNSIDANHSIVRRLIMDCLRYWVEEMHVDGFRFDLASSLARGDKGQILENPPLLWEIESDPVLADTKLIAEAWDAGGLYQMGSFIGDRWAEWNDRFRDDVRKFWRGDEGAVVDFSQRIAGSLDLFAGINRNPNRSINFITCHDGFTLRDLVSYNQKHNHANQEENRDGHNHNLSWNCGTEGETDDHHINRLRRQQAKNLLTTLFMSQGTPMVLMGDEAFRTQKGNNNAYCQDNELAWFNWEHLNHFGDIHRFLRLLIALEQEVHAFNIPKFWAKTRSRKETYLVWHGIQPMQPDWSHHSHSLAYSVHDGRAESHIYVAFNAYHEPLTFELPPLSGQKWHRLIDTAEPSPSDILSLDQASPIWSGVYEVRAHSTVVCMGH